MVTAAFDELMPTHPTSMASALVVVTPGTLAAVTAVAEAPVDGVLSSGDTLLTPE